MGKKCNPKSEKGNKKVTPAVILKFRITAVIEDIYLDIFGKIVTISVEMYNVAFNYSKDRKIYF